MPTRLRILLIDDDINFRTITRLLLETAGYDVQEAENGAIGLAHYRQQPSALVMMDIIMPVMEGFETLVELCRFDPNVKVVAMTAAHDTVGAYLDTAQRLGAVRTLKKPFSRSELLLAVGEVLGQAPSA